MQMRTLGTDLNVSAVGLGCMGFSHAYGAPTEEAEAVRLIRRAFDLGYTFFDTAEVYGTADDPHVNETLVGKALADVKNHTVIATKFGLRFDQESGKVPLPLVADSRPEIIRKSVEGSLKRLGTDHIDLYFQHRIDPNVEPETVAEVMADLIQEGKITHWGISEANEDYLRRAHAVCPVTAVQNRYSMMARHYEPLFPILEELDVGLVAFSPMANGFLTGQYGKGQRFDAATDYRAAMPQFTDKAVDQNAALLKLLADMAAEKGVTSAQISMAWMLCKHPWIVPIPGTRKEDRMKENAEAASVFLTPSEVRALDDTLDHMDKEGIVIQAWYPLGHGDKALIQEPLFTEFGKKYGKSNAQIILRWHIQAGNIVIPGSKNPAHIKDNFNLFDFALTDDEMAKITALDKQKRYYTSTPEMLKKYAEMVPPVDEQK